MSWFDFNSDVEGTITDGLNRSIKEIVPPTQRQLEDLRKAVKESDEYRQEFLLIENTEEARETAEQVHYSELLNEAVAIALNDLIEDIVGESEILPEKNGFTLARILEILNRHAFVQTAKITKANIVSCLENGGEAMAYVYDDIWRDFFNDSYTCPFEISGMRIIRIKELRDDYIICRDYASPDGGGLKIDLLTFEWLGEGGILLEVYK